MDKVTGSTAGIQTGAGCLAGDAPDSIQYVGLHREDGTLAGGNLLQKNGSENFAFCFLLAFCLSIFVVDFFCFMLFAFSCFLLVDFWGAAYWGGAPQVRFAPGAPNCDVGFFFFVVVVVVDFLGAFASIEDEYMAVMAVRCVLCSLLLLMSSN